MVSTLDHPQIRAQHSHSSQLFHHQPVLIMHYQIMLFGAFAHLFRMAGDDSSKVDVLGHFAFWRHKRTPLLVTKTMIWPWLCHGFLPCFPALLMALTLSQAFMAWAEAEALFGLAQSQAEDATNGSSRCRVRNQLDVLIQVRIWCISVRTSKQTRNFQRFAARPIFLWGKIEQTFGRSQASEAAEESLRLARDADDELLMMHAMQVVAKTRIMCFRHWEAGRDGCVCEWIT